MATRERESACDHRGVRLAQAAPEDNVTVVGVVRLRLPLTQKGGLGTGQGVQPIDLRSGQARESVRSLWELCESPPVDVMVILPVDRDLRTAIRAISSGTPVRRKSCC
jgi:hypothetical protein